MQDQGIQIQVLLWSLFTPTIRHDVLVSQTGVGYFVHRGISSLQDYSTLFNITIHQTTFVQVSTAGELRVADETVWCKGETMHMGNGIVDYLLEPVEYAVLVEIEEFGAQGQMVESKSDHVALPCKLSTGVCETGDGTFIFEYTPTCTLEQIQVFTRSQVKMRSLDEEKAILLIITGVTMAPQECGSAMLLATNYPKLFSAEINDGGNWPSLHPADLHETIQERIREDFMAYQLEKRMQSVQNTMKFTICQQTVSGTVDMPQQLPTGQYA